MISGDPTAVVVHDDLGHALGPVLELELDVVSARQRCSNDFGERPHRLGARLPRHEVVFDLYLEFNVWLVNGMLKSAAADYNVAEEALSRVYERCSQPGSWETPPTTPAASLGNNVARRRSRRSQTKRRLRPEWAAN